MNKYNIILASGSPRRSELLSRIGLVFKVIPSRCEEIITSTVPVDVVEELSKQKALDVAKNTSLPNTIYIGADTIVSMDNAILGKPGTKENAFKMIKSLQGHVHEVYTGVTIVSPNSYNTHTFSVCTQVSCYPMSDEEINSYIETGDPMDKAGSYGIQGEFAKYIQKIEGDYNNVVGLPISKLYQSLKELSLI